MSAQDLAQAYLNGTTPDLPSGHFINGRFTQGAGPRMDSYDPGLGQAFASFALGTADDIDTAIESARKAQAMWKRVKPADRSANLLG